MEGPKEIRNVGVYCSSSKNVAPLYFQAAEELGEALAKERIGLVYGGGSIGLMGALAKSVHQHHGKVVGVIPGFMHDREIAYLESDELIVTETMRERKAIMETRSDGFCVMPGGFGTQEEMFEILCLKQLHRHMKPLVFMNTNGFYDPLLEFMEQMYAQNFVRREYSAYYRVANDAAGVIRALREPSLAGPRHEWK